MRLPVHLHRRFGVGRVDEAKAGIARCIEPIGDEIDAKVALDFQIAPMRLGNVRGGKIRSDRVGRDRSA